jgi:hypothetical protein
VVGLVGDVRPEIPAHEDMPVAVVLAVEFVLDVRGDLLNGVHLVQGVLGNRQNLSLHVRTHLLRLYHRPRLLHLRHQFQI